MPSALRSTLLATTLFALQSCALPRPAIPSYSVVAVDGGEGQAASATTIIQTVTDAASSETTVSVTIEETPTTTTIDTYEAQPPKAAVTIHADASTLTAPTVVVPGSRTSYTTTAIMSETTTAIDLEPTTVRQEGSTVTIMSMVTPSTSYFDDGMWHTSYGVPVWPTIKPGNRHHNQSSTEEPCTTASATRAHFAQDGQRNGKQH